MEKGEKNHQILREFVFGHNLMDRFSNIQFYAFVTITTLTNKVSNPNMSVRVTFDGDIYGEVTLNDNSLDPYSYPTVLKARYQNMAHIDEEYLEIKDIHPRPEIGKYTVKIFPLNRLKD